MCYNLCLKSSIWETAIIIKSDARICMKSPSNNVRSIVLYLHFSFCLHSFASHKSIPILNLCETIKADAISSLEKLFQFKASKEIEDKSINKLMKILPQNPKQPYKFTYNPHTVFLLQSLLFLSLLFFCCYLTCYIGFSPNALKGKGCIFLLSLLCLHIKVRMNITFEIFSREPFDDLLFCIFVNTLLSPLQGINCLFGSFVTDTFWVFLDCLSQSWNGAFKIICFILIYFLQSHITPRPIFTTLCTVTHAAWCTADFFLLSLQGECFFHCKTAPDFWRNLKAIFATA